MKFLITIPIIFLFFFGCSDDGIPTSSNPESININGLKTVKTNYSYSSSNSEKVDEVEKEKIDHSFPTYETLKSENSVENSEVDDFGSESLSSKTDENYEETPHYSGKEEISEENQIEIEQKEVSSEETGENVSDEAIPEKIEQKEISYEDRLNAEVVKAMENYPRPPSPANLSPYDTRTKDSYRTPTESETVNGVGDFPPVPPAMMLNN
jgi:hypothetical protein